MKKNDVTRRGFIVRALAGTAALAVDKALASQSNAPPTGLGDGKGPSQETAGGNNSIAPHPSFAKFSELPLSSIEPQGWLKAYLEKQKDGITGHLDETGGFPFNTYGWAGPGISDVPQDPYAYEQTGYWVDGMIRCAYLLNDKDLIGKATSHTSYVLAHPDQDGYLGPLLLKTQTRWPHVVFFRALFAYWSATGEQGVPSALGRHFLSSPYAYVGGREACAIEAILWAYERNGNNALLQLAVELYRKFEASLEVNGVSPAEFSDGKPSAAHGVTYNEMAKLGALLYMETGDERYLTVSIDAYEKLDKFHMLVDGVHSSSEGMREVTPLESHETCDIADYSWSVGYLLMATGQPDYADKIERACFNAAPGAVDEEFNSLQYFSCPNQVVAAHNSNHNIYFRGDRTMSFATSHIAACCSGNVNRIMPNYASRLWMKDGSNGIVAALYAPSRVTHLVGDKQQEVTITEKTRYPFSDRIIFTLNMKESCEFPFTVRVPGWCEQAKISINDEPLDQELKPGSFVRINRKYSDGDEVVLVLPQAVRASTWPYGGIAIEKGPLVYSLKIEEEWQTPANVAEAAIGLIGAYNLQWHYPGLLANNVYAKSAWNYALDIDVTNVSSRVHETASDWQEEHPWSRSAPPIKLRVPARRLIGWELEKHKEITLEGGVDVPGLVPLNASAKDGPTRFKLKGDFVFTPQLPTQPTATIRLASETEMVTLVPYGCAKLRVTIFPHVGGLKGPQSS